MPRDQIIKRAFEIADDGIQGVFGYHLYVVASRKSADLKVLVGNLPQQSFPITHDWIRFYSPDGLHQAMTEYFDYYQARVSLISIISLFEGALQNFQKRLISLQILPASEQRGSYKQRLEWAFNLVDQYPPQSKEMLGRLAEVSLDIDHARRIRNLWMHNNGLFDDEYANAIQGPNSNPLLDPNFQKYQRDKRRRIPFIMTSGIFLKMYLSHVERLHEIHDSIQRAYFGQKRSYNYKTLKKVIEWHRLLVGM